jgi:hypothetical protein
MLEEARPYWYALFQLSRGRGDEDNRVRGVKLVCGLDGIWPPVRLSGVRRGFSYCRWRCTARPHSAEATPNPAAVGSMPQRPLFPSCSTLELIVGAVLPRTIRSRVVLIDDAGSPSALQGCSCLARMGLPAERKAKGRWHSHRRRLSRVGEATSTARVERTCYAGWAQSVQIAQGPLDALDPGSLSRVLGGIESMQCLQGQSQPRSSRAGKFRVCLQQSGRRSSRKDATVV